MRMKEQMKMAMMVIYMRMMSVVIKGRGVWELESIQMAGKIEVMKKVKSKVDNEELAF